ncbi:MAG: hypothetical protein ACC657_16860 [Thiohalomonadales bacterium]
MNPAIQNPLPDMPTLFVSHGTPLLALDTINGNDYTQWSHCIPKPKAILVFSAHWESEQLTIGRTTTHDSLVYDFFEFPEHFRALLIAAGTNNMQNIIFPIEGFEAGIFSRRSVQFN